MENIKVNYLTFYFGTRCLFADTSFAVNKGDIIYLEGISGSGKTTLLKILAGIIKPPFGRIEICEKPLSFSFSKDRWQIDKIGFLFQDIRALQIKTKVYDDILFALNNLSEKEKLEKFEYITNLFKNTALTSILERSILSLSSSEKIFVALASVLIKQPEILFLDEPFCVLDSDMTDTVLKIIKNYAKDKNASVIFTSHNTNFSKDFYNRRFKIKSSTIVEENI